MKSVGGLSTYLALNNVPQILRPLQFPLYIRYMTNTSTQTNFLRFGSRVTMEEWANKFSEDNSAGVTYVSNIYIQEVEHFGSIKFKKPKVEGKGRAPREHSQITSQVTPHFYIPPDG